jgi:hypothetical protein
MSAGKELIYYLSGTDSSSSAFILTIGRNKDQTQTPCQTLVKKGFFVSQTKRAHDE